MTRPRAASSFSALPRAINKCPQCGTSVSQFAAGCAICGYDLVAAREAASGATISDRFARFEPAFLRSSEARREIAVIAIMALVAFFMPIVGLPLCGYVAYTRNRDGDNTMRNIALVLAAVSIFQLATVADQDGVGWWWIP